MERDLVIGLLIGVGVPLICLGAWSFFERRRDQRMLSQALRGKPRWEEVADDFVIAPETGSGLEELMEGPSIVIVTGDDYDVREVLVDGELWPLMSFGFTKTDEGPLVTLTFRPRSLSFQPRGAPAPDRDRD